MFEESLCRNAPPQQARTAKCLLLLDDSHFEPELGASNGGDIPARSSADDNEVVLVCHACLAMRAGGVSRLLS